MIRYLCLLLLITLISAEFQKEGKNVLIFDDSNIEEAMTEFENLFIIFIYQEQDKEISEDNKKTYDQWEWLANEFTYETENFEVAVGKMDCTGQKNKEGCEKYMKKGYVMPVISFFSRHLDDPKGIFYMEQKNKDRMFTWLSDHVLIEREITGPNGGIYLQKNGVLELTEHNYQQCLDEFDFTYIQFYKLDKKCKKCSIYGNKWKKVGKEVQRQRSNFALAGVNCDNWSELCVKEVEEFPSVLLFQKGGKKLGMHSGSKNVNSLVSFAVNKIGKSDL